MRILKFLFIIAVSICIGVAGIFFYFTTHPAAAASMAAGMITRMAGVTVGIKHLSYAFSPLRISAKGIVFSPDATAAGSYLKIPKLDAHMSWEGGFGNRRLVIEMIRVSGLSLAYRQSDLESFSGKAPFTSHASPIVKRLLAYLFFKDIRIGEIILAHGTVAAQLKGIIIGVKNIGIHRHAGRRIEISGEAFLRQPSTRFIVRMPDLKLSLDDLVSLTEPAVSARIRVGKARIEHPKIKMPALELFIEGTFDLSKRRVTASVFRISADKYLQMSGELTARGDSRPGAEVFVRTAGFKPEKIIPLLPEALQRRLSPFLLSGEVSAAGRITGEKNAATWVWTSDLSFHLSENPFSYAAGNNRLQGRMTGALRTVGDAADMRLSGDLSLTKTRFSAPRISFDIPEAKILLTGRHPVYKMKKSRVKISRISGIPAAARLPLKDITIGITEGIFDLKHESFRLTGLHLQSAAIKNLTAGVSIDKKRVRLSIHGKKTGLLTAARALHPLPSGWRLHADDSIALEAVLESPAAISLVSTIRLDRLGIQDPASRLVGENITADLRVSGTVDLSDLSAAGTATINMAGGEILYDLYYIDLKRNPFSVSGHTAYRPSAKSVKTEDLHLALENLFSMDMTGEFKPEATPRARFLLDIPPAPISTLFKLFVTDPFQNKRPYLPDIDLRGRISAGLALENKAGNWSAKGKVKWREGAFSMKEKRLSVSDIRMDFPLWYETKPISADYTPLEGSIAIGSLDIAPMPEQAISFHVTAGPNRLSIPGSTTIRIPGGKAQLGPVSIRDAFSELISVRTDLSVEPTDMAPLVSFLWPDLPQSMLSGSLDPILIKGDRIETEGELIWKGFGGKIAFTNLGVDRFFTSGALLRITAELDRLNLGMITAGTDFGRIDGLLNGTIRDLEIAYGQAQGFDLLLETQKKKGIPQKISIKAVDNIARIGSGRSPFMGLAGAFTALFETLNYEKIGIRASLLNDVFKINGTVMDQGREYLMKGGLFAGVNIINQNPDNRIRFKDMLKRIRRVTTAKDGGPVIR